MRTRAESTPCQPPRLGLPGAVWLRKRQAGVLAEGTWATLNMVVEAISNGTGLMTGDLFASTASILLTSNARKECSDSLQK